jgi:uncharacterized protein (DUF305 family)
MTRLRSSFSRWLWVACLFLPFSAAAAAPAPDTASAVYETDFLEDMIDHHAIAVQMATLCESRSVHAELQSLCSQIRATQQEEIARMQSWLEEWYGVSHQPLMKPGSMKQMQDLAGLSGAEFEIAFMQMMIKHHQAAVRAGSECMERAYHEELRTLCEDIVVTQALEIGQMRQWLCDWYGICGNSRRTKP